MDGCNGEAVVEEDSYRAGAESTGRCKGNEDLQTVLYAAGVWCSGVDDAVFPEVHEGF